MAGTLTLRAWRWVENITPHPLSYAANYWARQLLIMSGRVLDGYGYGQYRITGTVRINSTLSMRRVTLLRKRDLSVVARTWSDPETGEYAFEHVAQDDYCVVCDDYGHVYNAAIADWVEPEPME